MNILAIDTTTRFLCVELLFNDVLYKNTETKPLSHSETLLPTIEKMLISCGATLKDINVFGVITGPGSFTGIRIGVTTIKAFAEIFNKPVIAVNSFEKFAYNIKSIKTVVVIDGGNGTVYTAEYLNGAENFQNRTKENLAHYLNSVDSQTIVTGDIYTLQGIECSLITESPSVSLITACQAVYDLRGTVTGEELEPLYIKLAQAEEALQSKSE